MTPAVEPAPYYRVSGYTSSGWADAMPLHLLVRGVREELREAGVERVARRSPDGSLVDVIPHGRGAPRLGDLRVAELVAIHAAVAGELPGAEWDLLLTVRGAVFPTTVTWDGDLVVVQSAPSRPAPVEAPLTRAAVAERWNLLALLEDGRSWTPELLAVVDQAMAAVSDEERRVVGPLRFRRSARPEATPMFFEDGERRTTIQPAQLSVDGEGVRIDVFDAAATVTPGTFVGTPTDPRPLEVLLLLHELGHAFARADLNRIRQQLASLDVEQEMLRDRLAPAGGPRAEQARTVSRLDQLAAEIRRLRDEAVRWHSPVEAAYAEVAGELHGPTEYGRTSVREGFAESFALYHADPDALRRALPAAYDWFAAGGHLAAAGQRSGR